MKLAPPDLKLQACPCITKSPAPILLLPAPKLQIRPNQKAPQVYANTNTQEPTKDQASLLLIANVP